MIQLKISIMKTYLLILSSFLIFISCSEDVCIEKRTVMTYVPVYQTKTEIRDAVAVGTPSSLIQPGALYVYQNYLLINDQKRGIHIYDNTDPSNPQAISFINIPGNTKLAVQKDMLYADNFVDLLIFDLSDMRNPRLINTKEDILIGHYSWTADDGVIIDYVEEEQELEYDCNTGFGDDWIFVDQWDGTLAEGTGNSRGVVSSNPISNVGIGGSLAKFTIAHNRLYIINDNSLQGLSLETPDNPQETSNTDIGWGIETIFPYKNNLFIGSQTGMYIFDASNPDQPEQLSVFEHARVCDPVFATEDRAYVTLRNGNECQGFINQLDVVNISDLSNPELIKSFDMHNPHGLSIYNEFLYLCEGDQGLKVFDKSDDLSIDQNLLGHLESMHAVDVISLSPEHLLVIGENGLTQLDVADPENIKVLSTIAAE